MLKGCDFIFLLLLSFAVIKVCSLSSHRHSYIPLIFGSRFIDSFIINYQFHISMGGTPCSAIDMRQGSVPGSPLRRRCPYQGLGQKKMEQDLDVLLSMITVRCYESVKKAYNNGIHAGSRAFGVFSDLSPSPIKPIIVCTRDSPSPSGIVRRSLPQTLDMTLSESQHGPCSSFFFWVLKPELHQKKSKSF